MSTSMISRNSSNRRKSFSSTGISHLDHGSVRNAFLERCAEPNNHESYRIVDIKSSSTPSAQSLQRANIGLCGGYEHLWPGLGKCRGERRLLPAFWRACGRANDLWDGTGNGAGLSGSLFHFLAGTRGPSGRGHSRFSEL